MSVIGTNDAAKFTDELLTAANDLSASVRRNAIGALASTSDMRAWNAIVKALDDEDLDVRCEAITSFWSESQPMANHMIACAKLCAFLDSPSERERSNAVLSVARVLGADATDQLLNLVSDSSEAVRVMLVTALGVSAGEGAIQGLVALLSDKSATVRLGAALVLGQTGDKTLIPQLRPLLADADSLVRQVAKSSIARLETG
jgi:HEAT repeat protein